MPLGPDLDPGARETLRFRLAQDAQAWLPTGDPAAHARILTLLQQIAENGVEPIAALRDVISRSFGRAANVALPGPPHVGRPDRVPLDGEVRLEPLPLLRRPTLWPQRPRLLPGELFSSWLWRTAVAAGVEPRRFALDVLGARCADVDRDVPDAALHRLALATGQRVETLASSTLREDWISTWTGRADGWASLVGAPAASPVMLAEHVALREPRLLLVRAGPKRNGRARPALQYCARCLDGDDPPRFRRGWHFAYEVACLRHRCRLRDACWHCGAAVELLALRSTTPDPTCPTCVAALADAPCQTASTTVICCQRSIACLLHALAVYVDPDEHRFHLGALVQSLAPPGSSVEERERALKRLQAPRWQEWFGPPSDASLAALFTMHAEGESYNRLFGKPRRRMLRRIFWPDHPASSWLARRNSG